MKKPRPFSSPQAAVDARRLHLPRDRRKIHIVNVSEALAVSRGFLVQLDGQLFDEDWEAWEPRVFTARRYVARDNPDGHALCLWPIEGVDESPGAEV